MRLENKIYIIITLLSFNFLFDTTLPSFIFLFNSFSIFDPLFTPGFFISFFPAFFIFLLPQFWTFLQWQRFLLLPAWWVMKFNYWMEFQLSVEIKTFSFHDQKLPPARPKSTLMLKRSLNKDEETTPRRENHRIVVTLREGKLALRASEGRNSSAFFAKTL